MNSPAVVGRIERGVRPHAEMLARRLQAAAYSHGYEDGHPANATTRQAKTDAVSRQTLADLLIAIAALANGAGMADAVTAKINDEGRSNAAYWHKQATATLETIDLVKSWLDDERSRSSALEQHLRIVLEVARTWKPIWATKMDSDTLANAAAELEKA